MRVIYVAGTTALFLAGVSAAIAPTWRKTETSQPQATTGQTLASHERSAPPIADRDLPAQDAEILLASLRNDRAACYASAGRDLDEPSRSACERLGYRERALVRLGFEVPPPAVSVEVPSDPASEDYVLERYMRTHPDDRRDAQEINQHIILIIMSLKDSRRACHQSDEPLERDCETLGYNERGLLEYGVNIREFFPTAT